MTRERVMGFPGLRLLGVAFVIALVTATQPAHADTVQELAATAAKKGPKPRKYHVATGANNAATIAPSEE